MSWAKGEFKTLQELNVSTVKKAITTVVATSLAGLVALVVMKHHFPALGGRVGSPTAAAVLLASCVIMQIANSETAAIRFGKREVFLTNSVVGSVAVVVSNYVLAPLGMEFMFVGFGAIMCFIVVPWVHTLYVREMRIREPGHP
jgi:hypothetical protein